MSVVIGLLGGERCEGCVFNGLLGCSVEEQEIMDNLDISDGQVFCGCYTRGDAEGE